MAYAYCTPYWKAVESEWVEVVGDNKKMVEDKVTREKNILEIFVAEVGRNFGALVLRQKSRNRMESVMAS